MLKRFIASSSILLFAALNTAYAELPKSVLIDQKQALILKALEDKNKIDCGSVIKNANELEQLNGKLTSPLLYYYRADCLYKTKQAALAIQDLNTYFKVNQSKDETYQNALLLHAQINDEINAVEEAKAKAQAAEVARIAAMTKFQRLSFELEKVMPFKDTFIEQKSSFRTGWIKLSGNREVLYNVGQKLTISNCNISSKKDVYWVTDKLSGNDYDNDVTSSYDTVISGNTELDENVSISIPDDIYRYHEAFYPEEIRSYLEKESKANGADIHIGNKDWVKIRTEKEWNDKDGEDYEKTYSDKSNYFRFTGKKSDISPILNKINKQKLHCILRAGKENTRTINQVKTYLKDYPSLMKFLD